MLKGYVEAARDADDQGSDGWESVGRTKSLTDEDLEELRGCLDLGFRFSYEEIPELCNTLPALELCYLMSQRFLDEQQQWTPAVETAAGTMDLSGSNGDISMPIANWKISSPDTLPKELVPVAWTNYTGAGLSNLNVVNDSEGKKVLMGVIHCDRPHYGVQFHPESIATRYGRKIFENFKKMTVGYSLRSSLLKERKVSYACQSSKELAKGELLHNKTTLQQHLHICNNPPIILKSSSVKHLRLQWRKIDSVVSQIGDPKNIFCDLLGDESAENTFWLDSSSTYQGRARFSFMGGKGGSLWKQLTFRLADRQSKLTPKAGGYLSIQDGNGYMKTELLVDGLFDFLNKLLWVILVGLIFALIIQSLAANLGVTTGEQR